VQGRKPLRRVEKLTEPGEVPDALIATGAGSASDEISLEDLSNAYAAALQFEEPNTSSQSEDRDTALDTPGASERSLFAEDQNAEPARSESATSMQPGEWPNPPADESGTSEPLHLPAESDGIPIDLCSIVEAVVFVGMQDGSPVPLEGLFVLLRDFHEAELEEAVRQLNQSLKEQSSTLEIVREGSGYRMRLCESALPLLESLNPTPREAQLSQPAIDCLSLIAYQPGITKSSIESQWGQPVGGILANLIKRGLVRIDTASQDAPEDGVFQLEAGPSGPAPAPRYFTTDRFLAILGLESLEDLPRGDEL